MHICVCIYLSLSLSCVWCRKDFKPATLEEIEEGSAGVEGFAKLLSPVFCSRGNPVIIMIMIPVSDK